MKKLKLIYLLTIVLGLSKSLYAQQKELSIIKWDEVLEEVEENPNQIYIINFWATWCRPCVAELPAFDEIHEEYKDDSVTVLLLSMDDLSYIRTTVEPFLERKGLAARVYLLDESDYNVFIPRIDSNWGGAIPATLILYGKKDKRKFKAGQYTKEELVGIIKQFKS